MNPSPPQEAKGDQNTLGPAKKYVTDEQWQAMQNTRPDNSTYSNQHQQINNNNEQYPNNLGQEQFGYNPYNKQNNMIVPPNPEVTMPAGNYPTLNQKKSSLQQFRNSFNQIRRRVLDEKPESRISKIVTCWVIWLFIFLFLVLIANVALTTWSGILAIGAISSLDEAEVVATIGKTLTAQPFYDFEVIQSSQECSSGFKQSPFGHWVGSQRSCNCDGRPISLSECRIDDEDRVRYRCPVIEKIEPIPLNIWKNYKLCLKQYSKQFTLTTQRQSCQFDQKKCFDYLCVPFNDECPITYLEWSNTTPSSTTSYKPFGSIGYLIYRRGGVSSQISWEDKEEPLIAFGIDQEGKICLMDGYTNKKDPQYSLLSSSGCGIQGERTKIIQIDTIKEPTLYDQNSLESSVYNILPGYKDFVQNANQDMTWVSIPRFKLQQNSICMNQNLYDNIVDLKDNAEDGFGTQVGIILSALILTLFNCCSICLISCCFTRCCKKSISMKKDKGFMFCSALPQIILAPIVIGIYSSGQKYRQIVVDHSDEFQLLQSSKCFVEDNLNKVVIKYQEDYLKATEQIWGILQYPYSTSITMLVLIGISIILFIIAAIVKK